MNAFSSTLLPHTSFAASSKLLQAFPRNPPAKPAREANAPSKQVGEPHIFMPAHFLQTQYCSFIPCSIADYLLSLLRSLYLHSPGTKQILLEHPAFLPLMDPLNPHLSFLITVSSQYLKTFCPETPWAILGRIPSTTLKLDSGVASWTPDRDRRVVSLPCFPVDSKRKPGAPFLQMLLITICVYTQ